MQVSRDRIPRLARMCPPLPASVCSRPAGPALPALGGASTGGTYSLGVSRFSVSGGSFTFLATDSNTKILRNPAIRALNDQKATLRIGDRVPSPPAPSSRALSAAGREPSCKYAIPVSRRGCQHRYHPAYSCQSRSDSQDDAEISSVTGSESIGGITQPIIGQRRSISKPVLWTGT